MIFCIYVGPDLHVPTWLDLARRFAAWAGLRLREERAVTRDQRHACLVTLTHPAARNRATRVDGQAMLVRSRGLAPAWRGDSASGALREIEQPPGDNSLRAAVLLDPGEVLASVPIATPEHLYYVEDGRGVALANDLRLLGAWTDGSLRPAALLSLLQYGMIPAPYSPFERVARVPPGHVLKIGPGRPATLSPLPGPAEGTDRQAVGQDSETLFLTALDEELARVPDACVLYLSGGVDSAILASRLAGMGRSDVIAVNFAFGPEDEEARLALQVAARLGLRCEQVSFDPGELSTLLARVGRDYSYPFGDDSTIPTNLLVHGTLKALGTGRTVLEGTGADGGFGPVVQHPERWRRLYRAPGLVRRGLGATYRWLRLWETVELPSVAVLAATARQAARLPLDVAAVLSPSPFDGILYDIPAPIGEDLASALISPLSTWGASLTPRERFALLDLVHVCANRFAAKSFDPLRLAGMDPVYPYLEPSLLRASFRLPWEEKAWDGEGKVLLKRLLARHLPREWIYRPKSAFDAPLAAVLGHPAVQERLRGVVLSARNPLLDLLDARLIERMVDRARQAAPLRMSAQRFLWTILFVSAWLDGVRPSSIREVSKPS